MKTRRRAPKALSDTQREVLVKLADGWELTVRWTGFESYAFLTHDNRRARVNMQTLRLLFSREYFSLSIEGSDSKVYTISEAGHEALGHER